MGSSMRLGIGLPFAVVENQLTSRFVIAVITPKKIGRGEIMSKNENRKSKQAKRDIDDVLKSKEKAFVLFYASWCPYSQRFLPIFEDYAKGNPNDCMSVIIDDKPDLCEKYEIEYYPTVLLFKKGEVEKRLDATPGLGLTKKQLKELTAIK
jgi:thiol-disulfide isomerase/thioredoxin